MSMPSLVLELDRDMDLDSPLDTDADIDSREDERELREIQPIVKRVNALKNGIAASSGGTGGTELWRKIVGSRSANGVTASSQGEGGRRNGKERAANDRVGGTPVTASSPLVESGADDGNTKTDEYSRGSVLARLQRTIEPGSSSSSTSSGTTRSAPVRGTAKSDAAGPSKLKEAASSSLTPPIAFPPGTEGAEISHRDTQKFEQLVEQGDEVKMQKGELFAGKKVVILADLHGEQDNLLRKVVEELGGEILDVTSDDSTDSQKNGGAKGKAKERGAGELVSACDWILVRLERYVICYFRFRVWVC